MVDSHCHLDNRKYEEDREKVIERAKKEGVTRFLIPAADPTDLPTAIQLAERFPEVYFAVGVHPTELEQYRDEVLTDYITHPKCLAVGEIGLDYYWVKEPTLQKRQRELFRRQIEIALHYNKPIIIHTRDSVEDTCKIVESYREIGGVFHCFTGVTQFLKFQERFLYGIGGIITFKNNRKLVGVFSKISRNRVILETDSPYLTPHPYRGKRNEPAYLGLIRDRIAQLWGATPEEVERITTQNFKGVFND